MHEAHSRVAYRFELTPVYRACISWVLQLNVLAEVETFWRIEDRAENFLKLLIRNLTIIICIKNVENFIELSVTHHEPPMVTEVLQLPSLNLARFAQVKVFEGTLQGLPLELELFDQQFCDLLGGHFTELFVILLYRVIVLFYHGFKWWILL